MDSLFTFNKGLTFYSFLYSKKELIQLKTLLLPTNLL